MSNCKVEGCMIKYAVFGFEGKKPSRCKDHKLEGMINVISKSCKHSGCMTLPSYGIPGYPSTHCAKHKQEGHICYPTTRCKYSKCKNQALYASVSKKPMRCEEHKLDEDINIVERKCLSCGISEILNTDNICTYCDPHHFNAFRLGKQRQDIY